MARINKVSNTSKDLPEGWIKTTIGEVTIPKVKQGISNEKESIAYIDISSIDNKSKEIISPKIIKSAKAPSRARQNVCQNDVLVSMTRPNLNAVAKVPAELDGEIASTGFDVLRPIIIEPNWLFSYVKTSLFIEAMTQKVQGALYPAVKSVDVRSFEINLPPRNEQKRIAEKIKVLQSKSQKAKQALDAAKPLLDKLRQSILASAFRGDLTAEWRKKNPDVEPASVLLDRIRAKRRKKWEENELAKMMAKGKEPKNDNWKSKYKEPEPVDTKNLYDLPNGWAWTTWESLLSFEDGSFRRGPFGSTLKKSIFVASGYKVYEQYCPINDDCSFARYYITPEKYQALKSFAVRANDFLISCSGVTLGRITQIPVEYEKGVINQALLRVRINRKIVDDDFFLYMFRSPYFQRQIFKNATGSAIPNVKGVKDLKAIPIPVAPRQEQLIIIQKIKKALKKSQAIESFLKTSFERFSRLDQLILEKAFRGELVPQDPSDEPAAELLARIKGQSPA